jgi:hypothetical protein
VLGWLLEQRPKRLTPALMGRGAAAKAAADAGHSCPPRDLAYAKSCAGKGPAVRGHGAGGRAVAALKLRSRGANGFA